MTGRATPAADPGDDTAPPLRRAPQAGGGEPITNGAELLDALMRAVRRAGFKELEDMLAGKEGTRFVRIKAELADVCQAVGFDMEATRAERIAYRNELENVRMLAMRIRKTDPVNGEHLLRFCARVGVVGSVMRSEPTNLERIASAAAQGPGTYAEDFAAAAGRKT